MKRLLLGVLLLLLTFAAQAQEVLATYDWEKVIRQNPVPGAVPVILDGRQALRIENTNAAPLKVPVLTIEKPAITATTYALAGEIRYDSVQGNGYLELWNYFPSRIPGAPDEPYFSRTLADSGPMSKITGTSGWRSCLIYFDRSGSTHAPTRLQLNLVLAGRGTVYFGPLKLSQSLNSGSTSTALYPQAWWSARTASRIGGWGGGIIGCLGGLLGFLASRGKARRFVTVNLAALSFLGLMLLPVGLVALLLHQPFFVWFPLLLGGVILGSVGPSNLWVYRKRRAELELRRMASLDA